MSQLSSALDALQKTGDVPAFVSTIANDLQKDFQILSALPGMKSFEDWLAQVIIKEVGKLGFSPTLAAFISAAVMDIL